mgnify:CR=1 FL=1
MLRSSQKDNLLSIQTLRWKHLGVFLCPTLRVLAACASAALAKNSPPDCFLHARTVLQEIIILSIQTLRQKCLGVFSLHCTAGPRGVSSKFQRILSYGRTQFAPTAHQTQKAPRGELFILSIIFFVPNN